MNTDRVLHDRLLAVKPEGVEHDTASCVHCKETASSEEDHSMADNTLSQEQHEALLASAVAKAAEDAATAARTEADKEIVSLNEQVAAASAEIEALKGQIEAMEAEKAQAEEDARKAALADERASAVLAVASFSDEQVAVRKATWASMDDEAFAAYVEDLRTVASLTGGEQKKEISVDGTRETATEGTKSVVGDFFAGVIG